MAKPRIVRAALDERDRGLYVVDSDLWKRGMHKSPLNARAWVLQEMVLSTRIFHLTQNHL